MSNNFPNMPAVLEYVITQALPGYTVFYDEGCDIEQLKNKHSIEANNTVFINLNAFNSDDKYANADCLLMSEYNIFILTSEDSIEVIYKIADKIQYYTLHPCFVTINSTDYKISINDNGGNVINDTNKYIQYNIDIRV